MTNPRLEELRAKFQENPRRYFAPFANELRKAGDTAQAIAVCRTHLALQTGHVSGHIVLGQALYEAGETSEARGVFTTALELDPENLIALRSLGEIAQVNGEFGVARQWYERLLDADPRNSEVSQLLKDLPAESAAPPAQAAPAEFEPEALPDSARPETSFQPPAPEPIPAATVHTGFTGSGPAYKSHEELQPVEESHEPEPAAQIELHQEAFAADVEAVGSQEEPAAPVMESESSESFEMIDFDAPMSASVSEAAAPSPIADDSFDSSGTDVPDEEFSVDFAPESQPAMESAPSDDAAEFESEFQLPETVTPSEAAPEYASGFELPEPTAPAEAVSEFASDFQLPEATAPAEAVSEFTSEFQLSEPAAPAEPEPPRAVFAERGFDGPVNDDLGWMTTPSAAFSELESAPEDWFDESAPAETAEEMPAQAAAPEASAIEPETDSWFDESETTNVIESTEITSGDEFWLPPELPHVTPTAEAAAPEPDVVAHEESPAPIEASLPQDTWQPPSEMLSQAPESVTAEPEAAWSESSSHEAPAEPWSPEPSASEASTPPDESHVEPVAYAAEPEPVAFAHQDEPAPFDESVPVHNESETPMPVAEASEAATEAPSPVEAAAEQATSAESQPPAAPFITETLAELYLQQGFRDEALAIYRQLAEREPANAGLRDRISAIESAAVVVSTADFPAAEIPATERAASQSVRSFFSRLARRAAVTPPTIAPPVTQVAPAAPEVPFATAASALANLFSASKPPETDEGAASTLAAAFTDPAGRPSRAAERELSLDHLFRDVPHGGSPTGGVTLDEFYSTSNADPDSPTGSGEAGSDEPGGTDIRQFTAWLEGLRKK